MVYFNGSRSRNNPKRSADDEAATTKTKKRAVSAEEAHALRDAMFAPRPEEQAIRDATAAKVRAFQQKQKQQQQEENGHHHREDEMTLMTMQGVLPLPTSGTTSEKAIKWSAKAIADDHTPIQGITKIVAATEQNNPQGGGKSGGADVNGAAAMNGHGDDEENENENEDDEDDAAINDGDEIYEIEIDS